MKPKKVVIGIDLMGSDSPPSALLEAICSLAPSLPSHVKLAAIGSPDYAKKAEALSFFSADECIGMEENPLLALRKKKRSSIAIGLRLLKEGAIDAFVSSGNTGALVSSAKMILGTFSGLRRPALLALMPTKKKPIAVLDIGANLKEEAFLLIQFAYLGAAYQNLRGIQTPRVGLLNIGSEPEKGTSEIQKAYQALKNSPSPSFDFIGNVEGKSAFEGNIDVLISDGFTGNIFLKTSEGIANLILDQMNSHLSKESLSEVCISELQEHLHYTEYPGALLAGVKKTVVKCHGASMKGSLLKGILGAVDFASNDFVTKLQNQWLYHSQKI